MLDEVPNPMRHYLMAEYIYKHYKPFGVINHHSIWIHKTKNYNYKCIEVDTIVTKPQTYNYKKSAAIIHHHFLDKPNMEIIPVQKNTPAYEKNSEYLYFTIDKNIRKMSGVFLNITMNTTSGNSVVPIEIMNNKNCIGTILFTTFSNETEYMVPISNHYLWHTSSPIAIRIKKPIGSKIQHIIFYKDIRK